jgi:hypothetical protein
VCVSFKDPEAYPIFENWEQFPSDEFIARIMLVTG